MIILVFLAVLLAITVAVREPEMFLIMVIVAISAWIAYHRARRNDD